MHERLVENWLDNASERSYQSPFCQMLAADGHRIVHSTRHSPIERGKDIVTVRDGVPFAFQLKGNPGGRLTPREFRDIEPQIRELLNLRIGFSEVPDIPHRSFLVTNGLIEEETRLLVEEMNATNRRDGYPHRRLELLQRGDLLEKASRLGHSLWPTEIQHLSMLLEMLVEDGTAPFPYDRAHKMLSEVLGLSEGGRPKWSQAEIARRITSSALLVSLSLKNYDAKANHLARVSAWIQFVAYAISACERFGISFQKNASAPVEIAATEIQDALVDLALEACSKDVLLEGDPTFDSAFYRARYTLLLGMFSLLWFWCERTTWPTDLRRTDLEGFLLEGRRQLYLWGEAAVPEVLAYYWFLRANDGRSAVEGVLASLLAATIATGTDGTTIGLPGPYWNFEEVTRHILAPVLGRDQDPLQKEATSRSFFAEPLLQLLVRTGRKGTCQHLWPDVTRTQFVEFRPAKAWQYCLWRTDEGSYIEAQPPLTKSWGDLQEEARSIECRVAPAPLRERQILHGLFTILFPHRATPDVVRSLAYHFDRTWFLPGEPTGA